MSKTLQDYFTTAYRGLRDQGFEKAENSLGHCSYRSPDGKRCAIGHCIPDVFYSVDIEGLNVTHSSVASILGVIDTSMVSLLAELQHCHDSSGDSGEVQYCLERFAEKYGLTIPS